MYEMFTGRPPYTGDNPMTIIQKAMAVDPAQRFQSMEALGKNLIPLLKQAAR